MGINNEILYLNERHSVIINEFLYDIRNVIDEVTMFNEDYEGFESLLDRVIDFHNGLGEYVEGGRVDRREWYMSLPNNLYWATQGYIANLALNHEEDLSEFEGKLLSLTVDVLQRLNRSLLVHPFTKKENKIHLN
jgi:hypothetical protein|tara:strand:- start:8362 stop:8766 length:405 start_codon:yes stop_codon:yes gene_type:complete